ncbi:MAG: hypothetical protein QM739_17065 [Propionivibrio sp.]
MRTTTLPVSSDGAKPARYTLALLIALFVLPFLAGTALFWSGWRPERSGNHGDLIQPPRSLPAAGLTYADGSPADAALRGHWLLVLAVDGACDAACRAALQQMTQVHRALNKEQDRLRRVLITTAAAHTLDDVQPTFPDLVATAITPDARTTWMSAFDVSGQTLFIVDPMGNVIMRYADPTATRGVLKDLERLLKYSWIQ